MDGAGKLSRAGFVLTGGSSSRMGRDKALLEIDGTPLVARIAERVRRAAGNVTLVGSPEKYHALGFPALQDLVEGVGPLSGIVTALQSSAAEWNLAVACDMPAVTENFLAGLLEAAVAGNHTCLAPETSTGLHPLCAVYHRRVLPDAKDAMDHKLFKMRDFLKTIHATPWPVADESMLENANTPAEWTIR